MYQLKEASDVDKKDAWTICAKHVISWGLATHCVNTSTQKRIRIWSRVPLEKYPFDRFHLVFCSKCSHLEICGVFCQAEWVACRESNNSSLSAPQDFRATPAFLHLLSNRDRVATCLLMR